MMKEQNMLFSENISDAIQHQESFEVMYGDYFTPLYKYVYFRIHDKEIAVDIVQTAFLKALEHKNIIRNEQALQYLFTIARNLLIDHFRKKHLVHMDDFDQFVSNISDSDQENPEDEIIRHNKEINLRSALSRLPEMAQDMLTLRYLQELEYQEIAAITGKTETAVRQAVSRSVKLLRQEFGQKNYENT